jgi:putative flippase GtrA
MKLDTEARSTRRGWIATAWRWRFGRYVAVGVLNTAFAYAVYAGALLAGAGVALASFVSFVTGLGFGFKTQGHLVFRNRKNSLFIRYVLVWLLIYAFNLGLITLFMHLGQNAFVAGALAVPFTTVLGYVLQRTFVFSTP